MLFSKLKHEFLSVLYNICLFSLYSILTMKMIECSFLQKKSCRFYFDCILKMKCINLKYFHSIKISIHKFLYYLANNMIFYIIKSYNESNENYSLYPNIKFKRLLEIFIDRNILATIHYFNINKNIINFSKIITKVKNNYRFNCDK